ncbi:MAG: hypothetical protein RL660_475 [Bacteroidota bacterium]
MFYSNLFVFLYRIQVQRMGKDRAKRKKSNYRGMVTASVVADIVGCEAQFVRKIWQGKYGKRQTLLQENVEVATALLRHRESEIVTEVKRLIKL